MGSVSFHGKLLPIPVVLNALEMQLYYRLEKMDHLNTGLVVREIIVYNRDERHSDAKVTKAAR